MEKRIPTPQSDSYYYLLFSSCRFLKKCIVPFAFLLCSLAAVAQNKIHVTGTIKDEKGVGTPNASVTIKNTRTGVSTDANGGFAIDVPSEQSVLVFSYLGYQTQEMVVGKRTSFDVNLAVTSSQLNDVVVVGYGTQRKVTVTGAVSQVKGSELEKVPALNLSNTLVGRLPGVTAVNASGEPGYDGSSLRIRGTNAFGNTSPLVVIDGIPERAGGLERLNPADVETISVLKDASAAIYGQRAANGVILITTKHGKTGKPRLSYDFNQGWSQATVVPKMMNVLEYGNVRNELAVFEAVPAVNWAAALKALQTTGSYTIPNTTQTISSPEGFNPTDMKKYAEGTDPWGHPNTNWFKDVLKNWSPQQRHNLQINGGNENIKYLASVGYQNQDGYYKNSATGYKQYDFRLNVDAKVNEYVSASIGIVGREEFRFYPTESAGSVFRMLMRGKPSEPAIWPNGLPGRDIENGQNPVVITTNQTGYDKDKRDYLQTNGKVEFLVPGVKGLKLTASGAADKYIQNRKVWQTPWYLYSWDKVSLEADGKTPKLSKELRSTYTDPRLSQSSENSLNINLSFLVNYDRKFGDHTFSLLAGGQKEKLNSQSFNAFRRYFISAAVDQLFSGGDKEKNNGGGEYNRARMGYFGRLSYNYQEKYIVELLGRYDGSYIFPADHRFGFFPGVMAGWRASEEKFFKDNVHFIDNLKLRASWGQVGAEPYIPGTSNLAEIQYLSTYGFSSYIIDNTVTRGLFETILPNPNFTWEVQTSQNIGIEASALNNRLNVEFDYFINKRDKALFSQNGIIPASAGISNILPPVNYAKLSNKGWEFKVGYAGEIGKLKYNVGVNGGYSKNKIVLWNEVLDASPEYQHSTGKPFGSSGSSYLVYQYDGVFATQKDIDANTIDYSAIGGANLRPGDMKFKDINGDKKITNDDKVRLDKTRDPTFTGGITINLQYGNFDLALLFQGATGGLLGVATESGDIGNYLQYDYDHRWTIDNPSNIYPRIASRDNTYYTGGAGGANDYRLRSTNYFRFKNAEIGYNVPSTLLKRVSMSNFRIYANAINIYTWDKLHIFDPEAISGNGQYYPQARIINVGARVTF
ncbi:MAG TPA: TonB-dependent receptor [Chitinophagaceae bacterium]|nr:TonB-dependent receptor [Chitinophagaceae bacterium]